jgi:RNA polymerase sigma-70 factor (ECF subfamily)
MPDTETSLDLLKRLQAGDATALDLLIARYRPRMVRWASGRLPAYARDLAETQDLVQDSLVQAFRKIKGIEVRGEGALQAYLRQVLLNAIRMELRRVRRRPSGAPLADNVQADAATPLEHAIGRQTLDRYEAALEALRSEDREIVIAHVEFGFSHQELAQAFGKPSANAARMALQRALMRVAEAMKCLENP